jgi:GMP synthase (glutamine-hydrolysing)
MSTPGRVGNALRAMGHPLDIRKPVFGDSLPETLENYAGAVTFGGPMSANDSDEFIKREIDWLAVPLKEDKPYLGICLGAQMLAKQLGAKVAPHPEGRAEIGYYPIRPTEAGRRLWAQWPEQVYHWHREGFDLPQGCELLAEGDDFPVQAYRTGRSFGIQFHPDLTQAMLHRWTTRAHERMSMPGARSRDEHFTGRLIHDHAERAWLSTFLDGWLHRPPAPASSVAASAGVPQAAE